MLKHHDERRAAALNRGIREASGELITFLDADSILARGHARDSVGRIIGRRSRRRPGIGHKRITNEQASFNGDSPAAPSHGMTVAIYRREVIQKVGLFDQEIGPGEHGIWAIARARSALRSAK